ncbi:MULTISPECIES: PRD domain-containing protein [Paenibacillus]|uniref:CAT RNA binding domain protein n=1 Tax=Paenibacillus macerans TaxID=44252 RepID=A0A090Y3B9_PAEMA|nr:PRD domain-containing protein [Paenibacillus macerans]KFM92924.1 CAT RNA binding domain protein [Paenibacillus macerans]MCY7559206.1 PRD domain-containing protein [Paenibacillus macerans]MEC0152177.1 PRD domain-containing protein [Paenibacillus macerans]SUA84684.1 BglG family transcriptional antiterminator [Paenibacillus macerans]GBK60484.1 transcriptional antiterminator [Paenibacillus macerans]
MIIEKRINNNVVLAKDNTQQFILMGKGIGFQAYPGNKVNAELIEKKFFSAGSLSIEQMSALVTDASQEEIEVIDQAISRGEEILKAELNPNIFFTLLDHVLFAISRVKKQMDIANPLEWEIKKFYPAEYKIGKETVSLINKRLNVELPPIEAASIALHFVNGQIESKAVQEVIELTEIINRVVKLVKYHFQVDFDDESIAFNRFVTHLRYYLMRQKSGEVLDFEPSSLTQIISEKFPEEKQCADKIAQHIQDQMGLQTSDIEKMYLTMHIGNLVRKT